MSDRELSVFDDAPHAQVERELREDRADCLDRRPVFVAGQAMDPDDLPSARELEGL